MQLAVTAVLLALLAHAASASAIENRIEFVAVAGETRVADSEVCFFPADANDAFFGKFLATDDVRCLSADSVISLPPGLFNVFARHGSTLIDSHPTFLDNANPGEPGYRAVELELQPAATLEVRAARSGLRDGEWLAVYLTNEGRRESLASVHPVPRGETQILVPADMPFVPLVVRRGAIVRVGKPMQLRAGETQSLPKPDQWGAGRDVIALLRTDALTSPDVPPQPPRVELHGAGAEPLRPMFAPRGAGRFEGSLAIFKDVPAGTHPIRLSGDGWQRDESIVAVTSDATSVTVARPLVGRIAATVEVRASIGELATAFDDVPCAGDKALGPRPDEEVAAGSAEPSPGYIPVLRLLRCDGQGCTAVRQTIFPRRQPEMTATWSDLEPGVYAAEVTYRFLTARSSELEVRAGRAQSVSVALQPDRVTGRVKLGGAPVQALVNFIHSVAPVLSDEAGNYTSFVWEEQPQRTLVTVRICGGGLYRFRTKTRIGKAFDIDIPQNELVVHVVDHRGQPLGDATLVGGPMFPEGDGVDVYLPFVTTDARGEARLANVTTEAALEMCASRLGYATECATGFEMGDGPVRRIEIALQPQAMMSGRLVSQKPFFGARIYLVSPHGAVVSSSAVSPSGEFTLRKSVPGEYLISDSLSHPLAVLELPSADDDAPLELAMPAQSRTVSVVLSPKSHRRKVAMELAGRIIPDVVLLNHQMSRRRIHELEPGETLAFPDLGPGPLTLYSLPATNDWPPEWFAQDPMENPSLRVTFPRFPVTEPLVAIE